MDPTWLARKFVKELIRKPNLKFKEMQGLVEASKDILPYVEHMQCAKHIYADFRKVYSGVEFRNIFWVSVKSTTEGYFKFNMERIKAISYVAYDHLMAREPTSWCRAYFSTAMACEAVDNGIVECFNAIIIDSKKKPLLTMLEEIRLYMMERGFNLKQEAENWKNLEKTLSKLWELSWVPCVHAQVATLYTNQDPVNFISSWFNKNNYKATYDQNIVLVNGSNLWEETSYNKPLPPIERRMPGRPSVKRRRHVSENQDKPRLEPDLLNWLGTKRGIKGDGRAGGGRSRGGGRGSSKGVQIEYEEGTYELPKCEPEHVTIQNVESENDASPDFHNHISITIDNLRKSLYTTEQIMDYLGLSEAELQQIEGLGLSEQKLQQIEGLGLSAVEVQQIEDADVAMSQVCFLIIHFMMLNLANWPFCYVCYMMLELLAK
ncbi:unnamed protein product [Lactuca saligna]|uniref:Uncharacterized protein n=1 Tax=Lactuca saligna TaxID=75948 RepID=A0AA36EGJ6_LACSI|nr:unnamed protein product [Lactuca saligna]